MTDQETVVLAFGEEHVERLTKLTRNQLRYWDRTGFFSPTYAEEGEQHTPYSRVYSFRDVVGLRTLGILRKQHNVSLQHLRQVAELLSHLKDELWTSTTLYVLNKKVVFHEEGSGQLREVVSNQYVVGIPLHKVISDVTAEAENLRQRAPDQVGKIERHRFVARNAPVVAGTRIKTAAIKRFRDAGYSNAEIIKEYPDLTEQDIRAALVHEDSAAA